jgi:hypothetical protein
MGVSFPPLQPSSDHSRVRFEKYFPLIPTGFSPGSMKEIVKHKRGDCDFAILRQEFNEEPSSDENRKNRRPDPNPCNLFHPFSQHWVTLLVQP